MSNLKLMIQLVITQLLFSTPIQEVFDNAQALNEYDKYLILDNSEVYTGSLGIYEGTIFIEGNGAILDLIGGGGIWIYSTNEYPAHLDIEYLNIINGEYYGVSYSGSSTGKIENCNFINNDFGLKFFDTSTVEVKNSNFIGCSTYGIGLYSMEPNIDISYCNFWNNSYGDLQENCPGWGNIWTPWEPENAPGLLFNDPAFTNVEHLDFSLLVTSPCIDSGDPNQFDIDGTRRDIGAYFNSINQNLIGDCNQDNQQNILDILYVINNCILSLINIDCECGDINNDNLINILDIVGLINLILDI